MDQKVIYSMMGLAALPLGAQAEIIQSTPSAWDKVTQNVADVTIPANVGDGIAVFNIGKLVPGSYKLTTTVNTKLYNVTVAINGVSKTITADEVNGVTETITFNLTEEADVTLTYTSEKAGTSGSEFSISDTKVELTEDIAGMKATLANNANTLAGIIGGYTYAAKDEDVDAANALKTKADGITESYDDYKKFKLYADKSTIQEDIDELEAAAAGKQAAKDNTDAYNRVADDIEAMTSAYNKAVSDVEKVLTGAAQYLLAGAKDKLQSDINAKIKAAQEANFNSQKNGTAVDDEVTNKGLLPTQAQIDAIVSDYRNQATTNKNKYDALNKKLTDVKKALSNVTSGAAYKAQGAKFTAEKEAADKAIKEVQNKVEAVFNKADQLTASVDTEVATANNKITDLKNKVENAYKQANAKTAIDTAIAGVQKKLDDAKKTVNAKVSADGKYKAVDYYTVLVNDIQTAINEMKPGSTVTDFVAFKANLDLSSIEADITAYKTNAVAAVEHYDLLQNAIADYQSKLAAARAIYSAKEYYETEGYDYKLTLDKLQKDINDISEEIDAAMENVGAAHWTALLAVDSHALFPKTFASVAELTGQSFSIVNAADGKAIYGTNNQNLAYNTFLNAFANTNSGYVFKIETSTVNGAYRLRLYTPAGTAYSYAPSWNSDGLCYLNSQDVDGASCFVASYQGKGEGKDIAKGAAWEIKYVAGKGFTLKNVGTGKYLKDASNAKYDTPTYFKFSTVREDLASSIEMKIAAVVNEETKADNSWTADNLTGAGGSVTDLEEQITAFETKYTAATLGTEYTSYNNAKNAIKTALSTVKGKVTSSDKAASGTAAALTGYAVQVDDLAAQMKALDAAAAVIYDGVTANTTLKDNLTNQVTDIEGRITNIETNYLADAATLGLKYQSTRTEENAIKTALARAKTAISGVTPTNVAVDDKTTTVGTAKSQWHSDMASSAGNNLKVNGMEVFEQWGTDAQNQTGSVISQTVNNLPNGVYDITVYAFALQGNATPGSTDFAHVYANGKTTPVTVSPKKDGGWPQNADQLVAADGFKEYTISNVIVSDGSLTLGLAKDKGGTVWHGIHIKSVTAHTTTAAATTLATQNTAINRANTGLDARQKKIDDSVEGIKQAVIKNDATQTIANGIITELTTYLNDKIKGLNNVTDDSGNYTDAVNKKTVNGASWWVYKSGLAANKAFTAEKKAVSDAIEAMQTAVTTAHTNETLAAEWVNKGTDAEPDYQISVKKTVGTTTTTTTYRQSEIIANIDAIVSKADAESKNYEAYANAIATYDEAAGGLKEAVTNVKTGLAAKAGTGAAAYYEGVADEYTTQRQNIITEMVKSLNARTATSTVGDSNKGFIKEMLDLKTLVNALQGKAEANLAKYEEQQLAYTETMKLWNEVKAIIDTDDTSLKTDYQSQLDDIYTELSAKGDGLYENYKKGEAIKSAVDFAAITAQINDVKAQQADGHDITVTADNKAAHESFMGTETTKGAIQQATEAYQKAVSDRATYSTSNAALKAAIDDAAATLDEALYNCPTQIQTLTKQENDAYVATVSPTVFDVSSYNSQALAIEQNITNELNNFKAAVRGAIEGFWTGAEYKPVYTSKVTSAESAINDYSDDAKKDAFKDVKDLIAKGDAGVASITLSEVEEAIASLENIDEMLSADKNKAAVKDLTPRFDEAETLYTTVKTYIEGVTIADDVDNVKQYQLERLENAYNDGRTGGSYNNDLAYAKTLRKTAKNRKTIKSIIDNFNTTADNAKAAVETAVANDVNNTKAYNEMIEAIAALSANLEEAENLAAQYKYETSFDTEKTNLKNLTEEVNEAKKYGSAVNYQTNWFDKDGLEDEINQTLKRAFRTERSGLAADITELKNQYNAYVAANGLNATANAFKADIDALEKARNEADIVDIDDPADGIKFNDIKAATEALIRLQGDIADKETELLAANASTANAEVLADFNSQLDKLAETASLDDYDEWVGQQTLNGKTLDEQITALNEQIAELKAAIAAEENISFYKDQYQAQIDAIEAELTPVAADITAKDAQFKANAAAYERLTAEINELQRKIDAAKAKVNAYIYVGPGKIYDYTGMIDVFDYENVLTGGIQKELNDAKATIEALNSNKALTAASEINKTDVESEIQEYLDNSAYAELYCQANNLSTLLTAAIDAKYQPKKYSSALWNRLIAEKSGINEEIVALWKEMLSSKENWQGAFDDSSISRVWGRYEIEILGTGYDYYYTLDDYGNRISKDVTSDADYPAQMKTVAAIQEKIEALSTAVDNLKLLGDANEDGKVSVLDYQKVANMILDTTLQPNPDDEDAARAYQTQADLFKNIDVNQSGVIEVGDLTAIVNYILNGEWGNGYAAVKGINVANENLSMVATEMQAGTQRFAINLENVNDYTAFQLDVVLPEGMTIVSSELGDRADESHKLMSRAQLDGSIRFLASSIKGETFSGNEGAVLYLDVQTSAAYKGGSVELVNILFSDTKAATHVFRINGETTGVDVVSTIEALKQKVYDLSGRLSNGLKKGINIIRRADGSSQKVMK